MPKTGKYGAADGIACLRNWSINDLAELKEYACSATQGMKGRQAGIRDWNGSYEAYGAQPVYMPGECFEFSGYTAPSSIDCGLGSGTGPTYTGDCVVEQVQIVWNWESSENIVVTTQIQGNGELVLATGEILDEAPAIILPTRNSKGFFLWDGAQELELCVKSGTLTFTSDVKDFANSCTAGWRNRQPGILDWTLSCESDDDDRSTLQDLEPNDIVWLRLYINQTEYYDLKWGMVQDFSGLTVNVETSDIISQTLNIASSPADPDTGDLGAIILPDLTQYWPYVGSGS